MDYLIYFATTTSPARLRDAVLELWNLDPDLVFAGTADDWAAYVDTPGPPPEVVIESGLRPGSAFDVELYAGEDFADACGRLSNLELATLLCERLGTRALIGDGGVSPHVWMLVTEDRWHGRIVAPGGDPDDEDELMSIDYALQPVPAAREIPVQAPPDWQRGWYDDGRIPESGYLDPTPDRPHLGHQHRP